MLFIVCAEVVYSSSVVATVVMLPVRMISYKNARKKFAPYIKLTLVFFAASSQVPTLATWKWQAKGENWVRRLMLSATGNHTAKRH